MSSTQDSMGVSSSELPLPPQFERIEELMSMSSDRIKKSPLVNVIGLVKDYQPPIKTKGSDFKCTITLVDLSTQSEDARGMQVMIFWPEEKMPHISGLFDVVLLRKFKVQMWSGYLSLLANFSSEIVVFHAASIPSWPLQSPIIPSKGSLAKWSPPSSDETKYSAWLFHHIDRSNFPDANTFQGRNQNAMNVREKYSLLKDVKHGNFYDLIGEVIRVYEKDGRVTLYISDYTAHSLFFNNLWGGTLEDEISVTDGDPYGYRKPKKNASNDWPGPYGKLSIQLTVYDSHARFVQEKTKMGDWLLLKNVQIKMGNQGGCIEGYLREDRGFAEDMGVSRGKVQIQIIRRAKDAENNDNRWKDGLRRKKQYWEKFKRQKEEYREEHGKSHEKRKADEMKPSKSNAKRRRKEKMAAAEQKAIILKQEVAEKLDLNLNVKAIGPDRQPTPLCNILGNIGHVAAPNVKFKLPFMNFQYKSNVRVVDFWPDKLEDFSVGRRISEYDVLSDFSGNESTDNEECMRQYRAGKGWGGERIWEWRFALKVVDAGRKPGTENENIWLTVDNQAAQMLLSLDAVNLRQDKDALMALRETLFILWGDIEEKKTVFIKSRKATAVETTSSTTASKVGRPGDDLPPDSDEESAPNGPIVSRTLRPALSKRNQNIRSQLEIQGTDKNNPQPTTFSSIEIKNKGFVCCLEEYGTKVPEKLASKADAGGGMRWKRMFKIFGTKIKNLDTDLLTC